LGTGLNGETFNVNGDTAAGAIAAGLNADRLLLLTDVEGVKDSDGDVVTELSAAHVNDLIDSGVIAGGMIPKVQTALTALREGVRAVVIMAALREGVRAVVIMDGRKPNACLLELFTTYGAGSLIRA
jgi:acetylglutamate kinase